MTVPPSRGSRAPAVIVDPFSSGALFAPAFAREGVPTVAVLSGPMPAAYESSFRADDYCEVLPPGEASLETLADRVGRLRPRCVLPGAETGVELAEALAGRVTPEVANDPVTTPARRHKFEMARAAAAAGLPVLRQLCTDDLAEVRDWLDRESLNGHDLVVKPPRSAGTDGVTRIPGGKGWAEAFLAQLGKVNVWGTRNDQMLVQEYVSGTEYVVDTFSHGGRHTVADVCRYRKAVSGSQIAVYDSMEWLPPDDDAVPGLVDYATAVLDAVGMRFGSAHVEIMMTSSGPRLIELNARPHGGGHPRFCRVATGDSQVDRTVRYLTSQAEIPVGYRLHRRVMVVFLMSSRGGVVGDLGPLARLASLESHYSSQIAVAPGDWLAPTRDLLATLSFGFVVLAHDDRSKLLADYRAIRGAEAEFVATLTEATA